MASKIDNVINRLEKLTNDLNEIKQKGVALLPLPPQVKTAVRTILPESDRILTDAYFGLVRDVADVVLPGNMAAEVINNPSIALQNGVIIDLGAPVLMTKPRKVTVKMKKQRKIQSIAFRNANAKGRKKDGTFRAGYDQSRIARMAQKECTKERQRLGLCEKPKRRSTRKGQVRKTARRAFE